MKQFLFLIAFFSLSFDTMTGNELKKGDKAPTFSVKDVFDNKFVLQKALKENDKVLVVFLRTAWCPVCNARTHELLENYDAIKAKGIEIVVVYQSTKTGLIDYVKDYKLPYRTIADEQMDLYKLYNLEDGKKTALRDFATNKTTKKMLKKGSKLFGKNKRTKYKAKGDKENFFMPGDFLINKDGTIEYAYYGRFIGDHWDIDEIVNYDAANPPKAIAPILTETKKKGKSSAKKTKSAKEEKVVESNGRF